MQTNDILRSSHFLSEPKCLRYRRRVIACCGNKFHYRVYKNWPLVSALSHLNTVLYFTRYVFRFVLLISSYVCPDLQKKIKFINLKKNVCSFLCYSDELVHKNSEFHRHKLILVHACNVKRRGLTE